MSPCAQTAQQKEESLVCLPDADGAREISFHATPGLYQLSVIADARDFDWEELYFPLHLCGNQGQRTGPWDFDLRNGNVPLIPSYWVWLDNRRIGLWFFQRVSVEDIAQKCFRGRMAFLINEDGQHHLKFIPYRPMKLTWMSTFLENDPEDCLKFSSFSPNIVAQQFPARQWAKREFWADLKEMLAGSHRIYAEPLRESFDWIGSKNDYQPIEMFFLFAADRLANLPGALDAVKATLDKLVNLPHWGNPKEDGYSHDGDMGAAKTILAVAWMYHALGDELDGETRSCILKKLRLQGERFLDHALLDRDYWGGSLLQDHGRQSMFDFGTAALSLLGLLPEAERWVAYVVPRIRRGLDATPRDGAIPPSSYQAMFMFADGFTLYRDALLAAGGEDVFDEPQVRALVDFLLEMIPPEKEGTLLDGLANELPCFGGLGLLNRLASKFHDARAGFLQRRFLEYRKKVFASPLIESTYFLKPLWGFLTYDPTTANSDSLEHATSISWFEDSGLAFYRNDEQSILFSVQCGPWCGYNANLKATGPCDRLGLAPGAGHFTLSLGWREPRLVTPEPGYRLLSNMKSCLLIDEKGQYGDIGYPQSLPSVQWRGEQIEQVRWDATKETGHIRLQLAPAYPEELGVLHYTRDFIIESPKQRIICRDQIALREPRFLSWLFQTQQDLGITLCEPLAARIGNNPELHLQPVANGLSLQASVQQTEIVWNYVSQSGRRPFGHVRYDSLLAQKTAQIDFILSW